MRTINPLLLKGGSRTAWQRERRATLRKHRDKAKANQPRFSLFMKLENQPEEVFAGEVSSRKDLLRLLKMTEKRRGLIEIRLLPLKEKTDGARSVGNGPLPE